MACCATPTLCRSITTSQHSQALDERLANPWMRCQGRGRRALPKQRWWLAAKPFRSKALPAQQGHGNTSKHSRLRTPPTRGWQGTTRPSPALARTRPSAETSARACSSESPRRSSHLVHTDHTLALEKGIVNTDQFIKGAKLNLDRRHQLEGETKQ